MSPVEIVSGVREGEQIATSAAFFLDSESQLRAGVTGYTQIMDNARLRAWRVVLKPGEATGQITQTAAGLRVYVHGGVLAEMVPGSADRGMAPYEGDFIWQDAGQTRAVKNTGTTLIEFVEFELK